MRIRPMIQSDIPQVKAFADNAIGSGYYSLHEIEDIFERSKTKSGQILSLVLEDSDGSIRGIRITYPPGNWQHGKGSGLCPDLWKSPIDTTAYFQSLFIDPALTGQGWGVQLSQAALEKLKEIGAQAVVCHSWRESPNDSSGRYLRKLGFELVKSHPLYWNQVDYQCTRCGKPCVCTADEMIKYL